MGRSAFDQSYQRQEGLQAKVEQLNWAPFVAVVDAVAVERASQESNQRESQRKVLQVTFRLYHSFGVVGIHS